VFEHLTQYQYEPVGPKDTLYRKGLFETKPNRLAVSFANLGGRKVKNPSIKPLVAEFNLNTLPNVASSVCENSSPEWGNVS
jgi:hypothetical protein